MFNIPAWTIAYVIATGLVEMLALGILYVSPSYPRPSDSQKSVGAGGDYALITSKQLRISQEVGRLRP